MPKYIKIIQEEYNLYKRLRKKNRILSDSYQDIQMKVLLLKILTDTHFDLGSESSSLLKSDISFLIYQSAQELYDFSNTYQQLIDSSLCTIIYTAYGNYVPCAVFLYFLYHLLYYFN